MRKSPGRPRILTESGAKAVIIEVCELGLDAPAVLAITGDPEVGTLCLMPMIVVAIDNMAAFKEYFPDQAEDLNRLSREA